MIKKLFAGLGLAALALATFAGINPSLAQRTVFTLLSTLTGSEVIVDAANATGAQFTVNTLTTYIGSNTTLHQLKLNGTTSGAVTVKPQAVAGTYNFNLPTSAGTTGQALLSGGGGSGAQTYGTLGVAAGGTGATTLTIHGVLLGQTTGAVVGTTAGTTGQLLQGATGADPAFGTTLSGSYVFSNALITSGNAAGVPNHIATASLTAPALTACGTGSPTITGTDTAGIVTMGTNATGCVITFNVAYTGAPYCVVSWIATPLASQSYVTSNTAITLTQTSTSGNVAQYVCLARAGG